MRPLVTVILPFYKPGARLINAADSILQQSLDDMELLLIANNPDLYSLKIAQELQQKDARVKLLHEEKPGVAHAANKGLVYAGGQFVCRMDADDIAHPLRLEKQIDFLQNHPEFDVITGQAVYRSNDLYSGGFETYVDWQNALLEEKEIALNRFVELPFPNPTTCWRKGLVEHTGMFRSGNFPEDYEFWLRAYEKGARIAKLPHTVLYWTDSSNRLTRVDRRYTDRAFHYIKAGYLARWLENHNPWYPDIVVWGAGKKARKYAAFLTKRGLRIRYFIDIKRRDIPGYACYHFDRLPPAGEIFIVSHARSRGARKEIREYLARLGYVEGRDFILAS